MFAHICVFEATRQIADGRQLAGRMSAGERNDDLIGVRVDDEVRVVRHHNDLAHVFRGDK